MKLNCKRWMYAYILSWIHFKEFIDQFKIYVNILHEIPRDSFDNIC